MGCRRMASGLDHRNTQMGVVSFQYAIWFSCLRDSHQLMLGFCHWDARCKTGPRKLLGNIVIQHRALGRVLG